jgi:hypothetical protein
VDNFYNKIFLRFFDMEDFFLKEKENNEKTNKLTKLQLELISEKIYLKIGLMPRLLSLDGKVGTSIRCIWHFTL